MIHVGCFLWLCSTLDYSRLVEVVTVQILAKSRKVGQEAEGQTTIGKSQCNAVTNKISFLQNSTAI